MSVTAQDQQQEQDEVEATAYTTITLQHLLHRFLPASLLAPHFSAVPVRTCGALITVCVPIPTTASNNLAVGKKTKKTNTVQHKCSSSQSALQTSGNSEILYLLMIPDEGSSPAASSGYVCAECGTIVRGALEPTATSGTPCSSATIVKPMPMATTTTTVEGASGYTSLMTTDDERSQQQQQVQHGQQKLHPPQLSAPATAASASSLCYCCVGLDFSSLHVIDSRMSELLTDNDEDAESEDVGGQNDASGVRTGDGDGVFCTASNENEQEQRSIVCFDKMLLKVLPAGSSIISRRPKPVQVRGLFSMPPAPPLSAAVSSAASSRATSTGRATPMTTTTTNEGGGEEDAKKLQLLSSLSMKMMGNNGLLLGIPTMSLHSICSMERCGTGMWERSVVLRDRFLRKYFV